jgi:hypothetical protein
VLTQVPVTQSPSLEQVWPLHIEPVLALHEVHCPLKQVFEAHYESAVHVNPSQNGPESLLQKAHNKFIQEVDLQSPSAAQTVPSQNWFDPVAALLLQELHLPATQVFEIQLLSAVQVAPSQYHPF